MKSQQNVAIISGCSGGLGLTTALKLVESDYIVYAGVRKESDLTKLTEKYADIANLTFVPLNINSEEEIDKVIATALSEQGHIDILINNASTVLIGPPDSATFEEAKEIFDTNVLGTYRLTQKVTAQMRAQNHGKIIFIGSTSGIESSSFLGLYSATKFAILAFAGSLATTLHKWNIDVSIIEPGAINTDLPQKIKAGTHFDQKNDPYNGFTKKAHGFITDILKSGISPGAVSDVILQAIQDPNPQFRYQTCPYSRSVAQQHLIDPDGTAWVKEHQKLADTLY
jgi:short-subunit dehydrogenase